MSSRLLAGCSLPARPITPGRFAPLRARQRPSEEPTAGRSRPIVPTSRTPLAAPAPSRRAGAIRGLLSLIVLAAAMLAAAASPALAAGPLEGAVSGATAAVGTATTAVAPVAASAPATAAAPAPAAPDAS